MGHAARRALAVAVALSLAPAGLVAGAMGTRPACADGLFTDAPHGATSATPPSPLIRRLRRVVLDVGRVFPGGGPATAARTAGGLTLNLFPDACVRVAREQATDVGPGGVQWVGRVEGAREGRAILIVDDHVMVGTVTVGRAVFRIAYDGDGVHTIAELDPSAFPRD